MEWWNKEPEDQTERTLRTYRDTLDQLLKGKETESTKALLLGVCFKYQLIGLARFQDENGNVSYKAYLETLTDPEIREYEAIPDEEGKEFAIKIENRESPITVELSPGKSFGLKPTFE